MAAAAGIGVAAAVGVDRAFFSEAQWSWPPQPCLVQYFPDSRTVIFPHVGHQFSLDPILTDFADRATTKGLDTTRCDGAVAVPAFALPE